MPAPRRRDESKNALFYGDNLDILRDHIADESVDLVYLDPPFNSKRDYSLLFKEKDGSASSAQLVAFEDTWSWNQESDLAYRQIISGARTPTRVVDAVQAIRTLLGDNDLTAYLVMMTQRLVELHRVLKATGSLYLHCDPTASHYLKVILDAIFGPEYFKNEIIWKRTGAHSSAKKWGPVHDVILFYTKSRTFTWNSPRTGYTDEYIAKYYKYDDGDGRLYWRNSLTAAGTRNGSSGQPWRGIDIAATGQHWKFKLESLEELDAAGRIYWPPKGGMPQIKRYLDELKGKAVGDIWDDIDKINPVGGERLGYPTQKPIALLERIISASSNEGDVVLDPFCGCGTAVDAAQRLKRRWMGIDITTLSVDLMDSRLKHTYGPAIAETYEILGVPRDVTGAQQLFRQSPFEFERWCVTQVGGQPNEKQVGDKGIDGVVRFPLDAKGNTGKILVSVKGGATNPSHVRDLLGTVQTQGAAMGIFICMNAATRGMVEAANTSGSYEHPATGQSYPRVQIMTVQDLIDLKRPNAPASINPYYSAKRHVETQLDVELF